MSVDKESSILLFKYIKFFSRGLAHKIRTPLAVISNEISYLSIKSPDLLSPKRCQEISMILSLAQLPNNDDFALIPLEELLRELNLKTITAPVSVYASPKLLKTAFALLDTFFPNQLPLISKENKILSFIYEINNYDVNGVYESLSEFYCQKLNLDSYAAPLIDIIFSCHEAKISIQNMQKPILKIEVQLK